jgi:hypothetical protein
VTTSFQFRDNFYALVPPWLRSGNGEKYMYTLELCRDLLLEKAYQAMTIRLPGVGDASNLPYLAFDRNLTQGVGETNAAFILRLIGAFAAWAKAGSALSILGQLQAYLTNLQPGVPAAYPLATIVNAGNRAFPTSHTTWNQLYIGSAPGAPPVLTTVRPSNFDWSSSAGTWWNWLVLPMALVPVAGLVGSSANVASVSSTGASFTEDTCGHEVGGVWVPTTSGTPVSAPWITLTGLAGLTSAQVGQWITLDNASDRGNAGTFQIVSVSSASSCVIANPVGVAGDTGLTWTIGAYPFIGPGPAWGAPGYVFGQGQQSPPAVSEETCGVEVGGVWSPALTLSAGGIPSIAWGLNVRSQIIVSMRSIVKAWKSSGTYYDQIVIAFDGGDGTAGSAYSPNSATGAGNPDGTFGDVGQEVASVWVPTRLISSPWDCYCQGTGTASNCTIFNLT